MKQESDAGDAAATSSSGAESQPLHLPKVPTVAASADCDDAETDHPPCKKTAMDELFGGIFTATIPKDRPLLEVVELEVSAYKTEPCIPLNSDPLKWWKHNEARFPNVAKLARRYLGVPATSVPSERVFSTAGDIVTAQRAALSGENVDVLIFLKKNLKLFT